MWSRACRRNHCLDAIQSVERCEGGGIAVGVFVNRETPDTSEGKDVEPIFNPSIFRSSALGPPNRCRDPGVGLSIATTIGPNVDQEGHIEVVVRKGESFVIQRPG